MEQSYSLRRRKNNRTVPKGCSIILFDDEVSVTDGTRFVLPIRDFGVEDVTLDAESLTVVDTVLLEEGVEFGCVHTLDEFLGERRQLLLFFGREAVKGSAEEHRGTDARFTVLAVTRTFEVGIGLVRVVDISVTVCPAVFNGYIAGEGELGVNTRAGAGFVVGTSQSRFFRGEDPLFFCCHMQ